MQVDGDFDSKFVNSPKMQTSAVLIFCDNIKILALKVCAVFLHKPIKFKIVSKLNLMLSGMYLSQNVWI